LKSADATADFEYVGAKLVPEELNRRLGLQPALDTVERQGRHS
jgi:hypothetical protein